MKDNRQSTSLPRLLKALAFAGVPMLVVIVIAIPLLWKPPRENPDSKSLVANESAEEPVMEEVSQQLHQIEKLLSDSIQGVGQDVSSFVASTFQSNRLRPSNPRHAFEDDAITIWHGPPECTSSEQTDAATFRGVDGFVSATQELVQPFSELGPIRTKFKIYRVNSTPTTITTEQYFSIFGKNAEASREVNSIWKCRWSRTAANAPPLLEQIDVERFEEAVVDIPAGTLFSDCTEAVLGANQSYREQLSFGSDYWTERALFTPINGYQGLAIGDVNNDGLDDFYLCQESALPNRLFVQNLDGTATDRSAESGVDWLEGSRSALFVDLDNDGDQDLVVATFNALLFMENDRTGKFTTKNTMRACRNGFSLSAADFDQDGKVDIYVGFYYPTNGDPDLIALPQVYHDANTGGRNILLRNDGDWNFRDVTELTGLSKNNSRFTFATSWEDFDNDGDLDLYVANDYGRNNLYRNDYTIFTDIAGEAAVEDQSFGMSVDWADCNQDGWMDLYVANMFSAAGNRATHQPEFRSNNEEARRRFQYIARGNSLFLNNGGQQFRRHQPAGWRDDGSLVMGITVCRSQQRRLGRLGRRQWLFDARKQARFVKLLLATGSVAVANGRGCGR